MVCPCQRRRRTPRHRNARRCELGSGAKGDLLHHWLPRHFSLDYFDFITRRVHKIADLPGLFAVWAPTISPDGHTFLFSGIEHSEGNIFLVEGFR